MSIDNYAHLSFTPTGAAAPLVLALHGTGGDEHQFAALVRQILPDAGLIAPRGDVSEGGAARFFRRTAEGVYDMDDLARATVRMSDFIAAHRAAHPGSGMLALGYSNGANILASVLMRHPALIDRAALLHPLIPFEPPAQPGIAGKPVLVTAGARDPICPMTLTRAFTDWLRAQGADLTLHTHPGGHDIPAQEVQALAAFLTAPVRDAA